ncbi:MAG: hypothetical protein ABH859_00855 [Pseudomonadota bacterium]
MNKKKTTKERNQNGTAEHYNAVLLEDIRSNMQMLAEGMQTMKAELKADIQGVDQRLTQEIRLTQHALEKTNDKIDNVRTELKSDIENIRSDMQAMEERLSVKLDRNNDRLEDHETRITALESNP